MNRHPSAVTSPPSTAVTRVDLRLQKAIVTGDTSKATAADSAPSQPATQRGRVKWCVEHSVYNVIVTWTETGSGAHLVRDKTAEA